MKNTWSGTLSFGLVNIPIGLALNGCAALSSAVAVAPQIATDAAAIASALAGILPTITAVIGAGNSVVATISGVVDEVKSVASAIAGSTTATAGSLVQQLGSGVATIAGLLGGFTLPPWLSAVLSAAGVVVSTIEATVGVMNAPTTARRFGRFADQIMTPAQARAILVLAAAK